MDLRPVLEKKRSDTHGIRQGPALRQADPVRNPRSLALFHSCRSRERSELSAAAPLLQPAFHFAGNVGRGLSQKWENGRLLGFWRE